MLNNKSILVTGGTGSFGRRFIEIIYEKFKPKRVVVFSRDELKQYEMNQVFTAQKYPNLQFIIGDIRDLERLKSACYGIDIVIHAAAMKQVPMAEHNPIECIKTNILGAENVINASLACGVKDVIALSTDKAASPNSLYGATKLCSDKLFVAANNLKNDRNIKFSVVRYGNVLGSKGSVIPYFLEKRKSGYLPITDPQMTRFNILSDEGVNLILYALENHWGGETFVPKIPSYKITDVATAIAPNCEQKIVGIRPGEKVHEEMITEADSFTTVDIGKYYAILPQLPAWNTDEYLKKFKAKYVEKGFRYNSDSNSEWETVESIRSKILKNLDPDFTF